MSIARDHAEWLSLVEVSGPFLSMPVLLRTFPHGLDADDSGLRQTLRLAYEEWRDNQQGLAPDPALHTAWWRYVVQAVLGMERDFLHFDQAITPNLQTTVAEYGETLRPTWVLHDQQRDAQPRLLGMVVPANQALEKAFIGSRWKASPVMRMLDLLRATNVPLGLLTNGEHWMLVVAPKGATSSFISWYAELWLDEPLTLRAFRSLLGVRRFFGVVEAETLPELLRSSADNQQEVTDQLGSQVRAAVSVLVQTLDQIDLDQQRRLLHGISEAKIYEAALTVMMRLVFLLSAEERGLLLLGDQLYDQAYAVSTLRAQLRQHADQAGEEVLARRSDAWCRLLATFRMIYAGVYHDLLRLPAYGGTLFDPDRFAFLEGRAVGTPWQTSPAQPLPVDNRTVLHLLDALQMLQVPVPGGGSEPRRLSFRALDIEQIGHVYEGLLDHTARRAREPMLGLKGAKGLEPEVAISQLEALRQPHGLDWAALSDLTGRASKAMQREFAQQPDFMQNAKLYSATQNDETLLQRVLPWQGLLREDSFGNPVVIPAGSLFVTSGSDRRATGTHYTPRSLTEPMVQHALEPLVFAGVLEGLPPEQWQLHSAETILSLKVCDMAMGSGAFLVQACRYLAERVVEAWEQAEQRQPNLILTAPSADPSSGALKEQPLPSDVDERLALARRLVADRCLYGVDRNPLAVEMAKLSLWLVTLQKDRPFTFLDHALRCGDSLLGVDLAQLGVWSLAGAGNIPLFIGRLDQARRTASAARQKLQHLPELDIRDLQHKTALLAEADAAMQRLKLAADVLAATALVPPQLRAGLSIEWLQRLDANFERADDQPLRELHAEASSYLGANKPLHWPLEFPEVFDSEQQAHPSLETLLDKVKHDQPIAPIRPTGFDAIIGNPPFMGGQKITGALGTPYREYLVEVLAHGTKGSADLCAYFFLRAAPLLAINGMLGLIATNTIAQGDTREVGLDQLLSQTMTIVRAIPSQPWPGAAALEVAHLWLHRGLWQGVHYLDDRLVSGITAYLAEPSAVSGKPYRLAANADKSFQGSIVLGMGFVLNPAEAQALIERDPRNREVLFPYLNGEDLNTNPDQSSSRWVINFHDWPLEKAQTYPEPYAIVKSKVKPDREKQNDKGGKEIWWRYLRPRPELYQTIAGMERVLVIAATSRTLAFAFSSANIVFSHATVVLTFDKSSNLALLQSAFHEAWARQYASSMKGDLRYTPSDVFETFPFPEATAGLEAIGERYHQLRQQIMAEHNEGLTKTYNRFHNPAERSELIVALRQAHVAMDQAVRQAYGWDDLALEHDFHQTKQGLRCTISEAARRNVLDRLLALNHQRYAAEVAAGLHSKTPKKAKASKKTKTAANDQQQGMEF